MNLNELERKLTAAARLQKPDDRVPYAFEKRIMAHITSRPLPDRWTVWGNSLWRAAVSCVAVALVCGGISLFSQTTTDNSTNLTQDFENTLLASADQADTTP